MYQRACGWHIQAELQELNLPVGKSVPMWAEMASSKTRRTLPGVTAGRLTLRYVWLHKQTFPWVINNEVVILMRLRLW